MGERLVRLLQPDRGAVRRRPLLAVLAAVLVASSCSGDEPSGAVVSEAFATSSTTAVPATTAVPSTTTTDPSTTTSTTTTLPTGDDDGSVVTWIESDGDDELCGEWVRVVNADSETCRDPATRPPGPAVPGTGWELPTVDAAITGEPWWHPPLALLNWNTVSLLTVEGPDQPPTVRPWAVLDAWADELRVAPDGTIVVQQNAHDDDGPWPWIDVATYPDDGSDATIIEDSVRLHDIGLHGQLQAVLYEAHPVDEYDDAEDVPLRIVPLGESRPGDPAFGLTRTTDAVYWGADLHFDRVIVQGWVGDRPVVEVRDLDGKVVSEPPVFAGHDAGRLPELAAITFSEDGRRITWVEFPFVEADAPLPHPPARLKSIDAATGDQLLDVAIEADVSRSAHPVWSIFDLRDHIVVNVAGFSANRWWPEPAIVIALTGAEPHEARLPVTGFAVPVPFATE